MAASYNPLAHFHPITLDPTEVKAAIEAVKFLDFPKGQTDFAKKTADGLSRAALNTQELLDAACWLRTTFEVDLRSLLKTHGGKVTYRDDWTKVTLAELWDSAKEAMNRVNNAAAAPLIADIETHRLVFLDDWRYDSVSRLDKPSLDAAWATLRDPAAGPIKTRLITFR